MKNILLIGCLIYSSFSFAYFSEESKNIILNGSYRFSNSWVGTVWSSCWARKFNNRKLNADHVLVDLNSSGFDRGKYLTNILINRGDLGENLEQAPVTFIINGIFGLPVSGLVKQVAIQLLERGHHVVGLGNPLGEWGIQQKPTYTVGNFIQESETYLDIMKEAVNWFQERNLTNGEVHLVGVSHGGFVGSIIKAMDLNRGGKTITGMTHLMSPPIQLGAALRNMDHALYQTRSLGKMPDWVLASVSIRFCLFPPRQYVDRVQLNWAKALFGFYGFQRSLADTTSLLDKLYDLDGVPRDKKAFKKWRRTFTFSDYIRDFAQDLGKLMDSEYGDMYYWLNQVPQQQYHIFASLDDPLNEELQWPEQDNQFLIPYGGHYGLRGFTFFDDFLYSIFE